MRFELCQLDHFIYAFYCTVTHYFMVYSSLFCSIHHSIRTSKLRKVNESKSQHKMKFFMENFWNIIFRLIKTWKQFPHRKIITAKRIGRKVVVIGLLFSCANITQDEKNVKVQQRKNVKEKWLLFDFLANHLCNAPSLARMCTNALFYVIKLQIPNCNVKWIKQILCITREWQTVIPR